MKMLSLEPDEDMRWIYDQSDPRYYEPCTNDLRERRARALRHAPKWMIREAEMNDAMRKWEGKTALRWDWLTAPNADVTGAAPNGKETKL